MVGLSKFNSQLHQDISRKELLRYTAIALISLIGIAGMLQSLSGGASILSSGQNQNSGYSSSPYGK